MLQLRGFLLLLFINILVSGSFATVYTTKQNGSYTTNSTWVGNNQPGTTLNSGDQVIIEHLVTYNSNLTIKGTLTINAGFSLTGTTKDIKVDGGTLTANGLLIAKKLEVKNSGSLTTTDSLYVKDDFKVNSNGSVTLDGAGTVTFNGYIDVTNDITVSNGTPLVIGSSTTLDGAQDIIIEDGSSILVDGNVIAGDDLELKDSATGTFNGEIKVADDFKAKDSAAVAINGDAVIGDDFKVEDNSGVTIGASATVEAKYKLEVKDGGATLTVNGAFIAQDGDENKGTINGTRLIELNGTFTNSGTITGSLDVCSGTQADPLSNTTGVSGGASICSSSGSNFPISTPIPLPIERRSYDVSLNENNQAELYWSTSSEINNDYFSIQRSTNGADFIEISFVKGAGTTNTTKNYSYTDVESLDGKLYYRIIQFDFDGKSDVFETVYVNIKTKETFVEGIQLQAFAYPNPVNDNNINLIIPSTELTIFSLQMLALYGSIVPNEFYITQKESFAKVSITITNNLVQGVYYLTYLNGAERASVKLLVK
jgi:hypothetical protein